MDKIIDISNSKSKIFQNLLKYKAGDKEEGIFLAEGEDMFDEAYKSSSLLATIVPNIYDNRYVTKKTYHLKDELYRQLSSYKSLPKVICMCNKKMSDISSLGEKAIYLDGIQDPGNLGTIIRTALAFSYSSICLSYDCVSPYNSKVIQSSKGAIFHLPIIKEKLINIKKLNYNIFITSLDGEDEKNILSLPSKSILVFGNEGHGVKKENLSLGRKIKIEMSGIDSLNVAVSASILMYRFK